MTESRRPGHSMAMSFVGTLGTTIPRDTSRAGDDATRDREALTFDDVYAEHFDFVWRSMWRLGVPAANVDDAVQDVFVVVHRRLAQFEGRSSIKTWLFGVAMRVARDHRRTVQRKGGLEALSETVEDPSANPHENAERTEAARFVQRFLDGLDADKRAVFILAELEEMTAPEIAESLGVNLNTVYSRIRAVRAAFEAELARHQRRQSR